MMAKSNATGFTLLEVLVALAVLAIGLGAIIKVAVSGAQTTAAVRERTLAGWVAVNRINELLLARQWPTPGSSWGTTKMAGRSWRWELQVSATSDPDLRRLDVTVQRADADADAADVLSRLTGFAGRSEYQ